MAAKNLYWVDIAAAPLANDRAKAERFGFAFVSCQARDYDVSVFPMIWWSGEKKRMRRKLKKSLINLK